MTNNDFKRVLWVDNNILIHSDYQNEARKYGLELVNFDCWDDAYAALKEDFNNWSAIILQPKSKLHPGGLRNAMKFLPQAFSDINVICSKRGRNIPWYLLTDVDESEFDALVLECRSSWDASWPKSYYDSSFLEERLLLFKRIKNQSEESERLQVRSGQYKAVFDSLDYLYAFNLNHEAGDIMEDLLISVTYGGVWIQDIGVLRKVLEYIFYSMVKNGILPDAMINGNDCMNNNACSRLLSCMDTVIDGRRFKVNFPIMNDIMARNIFSILKLGNCGHHAATNEESMRLEEYLSVTESNNLLNSCSLQICDVIIWYAKTLQEMNADGARLNQWWTECEV